jgi:importin subunit beta-1
MHSAHAIFTINIHLYTLTYYSEDLDDNDWDTAKAAGCCVGVVAQNTKNDCVMHVLPFVKENIQVRTMRYIIDLSLNHMHTHTHTCNHTARHVHTPMYYITLQNPDWHFREAAILAFGSILDGPSKEELKAVVEQVSVFLFGLFVFFFVICVFSCVFRSSRLVRFSTEELKVVVEQLSVCFIIFV